MIALSGSARLFLAACTTGLAAANVVRTGPGWTWICYDNYGTDCTTPATPTTPQPGTILMGGGTDCDDAFAWQTKRAGGGKFLILRASGSDGYNDYVYGFGGVSSVSSLIITNASGSVDPFVQSTIEEASAIFIAGGDQSVYLALWNGTAVQAALQARIDAGVPVGGTSAGMAVLAQYIYTAPGGASVISSEALADPYDSQIAVGQWFVHSTPALAGVLTDTHFYQRDRLGRTLAFMARVLQDDGAPLVRAIACDEQNAVIVDGTQARVVNQVRGADHACYFYQAWGAAQRVCSPGTPLTLTNVTVFRVSATDGGLVDLTSWALIAGNGGAEYTVAAVDGALQSTQANGDWY